MDLKWERYVPLINLSIKEINDIFAEYDQKMLVSDFSAIRLGCKNSNYIVYTNKGEFVLRLASLTELNNEIAAFELIKDRVRVPNLLFHGTRQDTHVFIYQYIHGVSLQKHIADSKRCDPPLLEQAAKAAAAIHNVSKEKTTGLAAYDVPPYETWYDFFLDNPAVRARIGEELRERVRRLVFDRRELIPVIGRIESFIHCDFRPANMLVDDRGQVYIVDWESAGMGHSLADIGQFFRYRAVFKSQVVQLFEQAYNAAAKRPLPDNWFALSLFRDLVNPLQLLCANQEAPLRTNDLISIIQNTLAYWEY